MSYFVHPQILLKSCMFNQELHHSSVKANCDWSCLDKYTYKPTPEQTDGMHTLTYETKTQHPFSLYSNQHISAPCAVLMITKTEIDGQMNDLIGREQTVRARQLGISPLASSLSNPWRRPPPQQLASQAMAILVIAELRAPWCVQRVWL